MSGIVTIESICFIARFHVDPARRAEFLSLEFSWRPAWPRGSLPNFGYGPSAGRC